MGNLDGRARVISGNILYLNVYHNYIIYRYISMYVCIVFGRHWVCIIIRVSM